MLALPFRPWSRGDKQHRAPSDSKSSSGRGSHSWEIRGVQSLEILHAIHATGLDGWRDDPCSAEFQQLAQGDLGAARVGVDTSLAFLERGGHLSGTEEPFRIRLCCFRMRASCSIRRTRRYRPKPS